MSKMRKARKNSSKLQPDIKQQPLPLHDVQAAPYWHVALSPAQPTHVYDTYWKFAAERQEVFFRRYRQAPPPWTSDPILQKFKFTNAYRAADRVSQFLLREVQYAGDQSPREIFFRTILFKLFNKIATWQLLYTAFGVLGAETFNVDQYDGVLSKAMDRGERIYSPAYIMPSGGKASAGRKHRTHLQLLRQMLEDDLPERLIESRSLKEGFEKLRAYPMMGDFLAYQYIIDLNYSAMLNFSEMEFVVPGPGARGGLRKCFRSLGGLNESDLIRLVTERQQLEFERLGIRFKTLWGRPLHLIDCQNLFCEVDKYARHAHPEMAGLTGRTRIKQMFRSQRDPIRYWFPPKWGLNELVARDGSTCDASVRGKKRQ